MHTRLIINASVSENAPQNHFEPPAGKPRLLGLALLARPNDPVVKRHAAQWFRGRAFCECNLGGDELNDVGHGRAKHAPGGEWRGPQAGADADAHACPVRFPGFALDCGARVGLPLEQAGGELGIQITVRH